MSPASGRAGQGRLNKIFPLPKNRAKPERTGEKEGGLGEGIFVRPLCPPKADWGWETARSCISRKAKSAKIVSLVEKGFCARLLKDVSIFVDFACRQAASRGAGCRAAGAALDRVFVKVSSDFVQKVPPIYDFSVFEGYCLALASLGLGRNEDFEGIFEIKEKGALAQAEVRQAKLGQNEVLQTNLFSLAYGERQSDNLITAQKRL